MDALKEKWLIVLVHKDSLQVMGGRDVAEEMRFCIG